MRSRKRSVCLKLVFTICVGGYVVHAFLSKYIARYKGPAQSKLMTRPWEPIKYILLWTPANCDNCEPFNTFGTGRIAFKRLKCKYTNCYMSSNRTLLGDYAKFDAILFNGRQIGKMGPADFPSRRSPKQHYVFIQLESADRFPVCNRNFDNFFNRTFTYRLDSDFVWPYIKVALLNGTVVGPRTHVQWMAQKDMWPIGEQLRTKLRNKKKASAWFVSNCRTRNQREVFVRRLQKELQRYRYWIDEYGKCGRFKCPRKFGECYATLQREYFFYLALENSFAEDYVTEKLLTAVQHNAVPVVYGAADYTRFLPPGSYLNALELGPRRLAAVMADIMSNLTRYYDMFRWRQHYTFQNSYFPPPVCSLCEELNYPSTKVYKEFRKWWLPKFEKRCMSRDDII